MPLADSSSFILHSSFFFSLFFFFSTGHSFSGGGWTIYAWESFISHKCRTKTNDILHVHFTSFCLRRETSVNSFWLLKIVLWIKTGLKNSCKTKKNITLKPDLQGFESLESRNSDGVFITTRWSKHREPISPLMTALNYNEHVSPPELMRDNAIRW